MTYEALITIVVLAILVEFSTEIFKSVFTRVHGSTSRIVAILIGMILCLTTQSGILSILNIHILYPQADYIMTGLIISRGSNIIHDLISRLGLTKSKI